MPKNRLSVTGWVRLVLAAGFTAGLAFGGVWPTSPANHVSASVPEIILQVNDTVVSPLDDRYLLSVYLTNVLQEVAGLEITISAGNSGLIRLPDSVRIETTIVCIDPIDCDPADTTMDTIAVSPVDLTGSVIAGWDFIQARALSPYTFRIAAVADFPGGGTPAPIPVATLRYTNSSTPSPAPHQRSARAPRLASLSTMTGTP